jgi:AraC family transcriptional regulator
MNLHSTPQKRRYASIDLAIKDSCTLTCNLAQSQINNAFHFYSVKMAVEGNALYQIGHRKYKLNEGAFLVSNCYQHGMGIVDSKSEVIQFCVHIDPLLITQICNADQSISRNELDLQHEGDTLFHLFENTYHINSYTEMSKMLRPINRQIKNGGPVFIDEDWLQSFGEAIAAQENKARLGITGLSDLKPGMRNELMRRLFVAQDYMHSNIRADIKVKDVAQASLMNEAMFYKCFKAVFKKTPKQYILDRRLELAVTLLREPLAINDIASITGFADIVTFSKAFKRKYGKAPSYTRR